MTFAVLLAFVAMLAWEHFNKAKAASYAEAAFVLDVYNVSVGFAESQGFVTATLSSTHGEPRLAMRHATATASCHCAVASVPKIRRVDREMRWR